ncbi:hypothetical protein V1505DRAFT_318458 [Lipomyces doorenjongii]
MSVSATVELYSSLNGNCSGMYFYHGRLNATEKQDIFCKWVSGEYKLLFCTGAFGVGIDYSNVSLVIHYDGIWSVQDFVQESGRAGRNQALARSLVLVRSHWVPDFSRIPASEAQEVVDYLNPQGLCRRFILGRYMDGAGYSCLTYGGDTEICDQCRVTQHQIAAQRSMGRVHESPLPTQHVEGPIPAIKRVKTDDIATMKDKVEAVFSSVKVQYGGCVFCALDRQVTLHGSQVPQQLLTDHGINPSLFGTLDKQLSARIEGRCYGCGLNLRLLNGMDEHISRQGCVYSTLTRLVCYDIYVRGKMMACLARLDQSAFRANDISSFGKWLRMHPVGQSVNNLTRVVYNWMQLEHLDGARGSTNTAPGARPSSNPPARLGIAAGITDTIRGNNITTVGQREPRSSQHGSSGGLGFSSVEINWPAQLLPVGPERVGSNQYRRSDVAISRDRESRNQQSHHGQGQNGGIGYGEASIDMMSPELAELFDN